MKSAFLLTCALLFSSDASVASALAPPITVKIPRGTIKTITCPADVKMCAEHEYVERTVTVPAFELGATEVTFAQYDACVADGGCVSPPSSWAFENREPKPPCSPEGPCNYPFDEGWGRGELPVVNVSWKDAAAYIDWLNRKTGASYRLPSAVEWEYAARAGARTAFPWGDKLGKNKANCDGCGSKWDNRQTAPVGSFKPNRFGLFDMVGNVNEWVSDCIPSRSKGSQTCMKYLYFGGAWLTNAQAMTGIGYNSVGDYARENHLGFRIAR
ncbi:formylglycine-generating enzyme family protein [Massilia sp. PAMC28688]|uniref:formylglycine-generating enzyme family protein n=1 Tax=Massilia sp. PAMC28688 TaxID=2861283 RepID=UPI001C62906F|nr:SUMF1/EgtB/PvdO family nonheme iron enzyme [Massilia sp. PAMC28688]QYF94904.1 formylglycine-generating enzyme family protein [Massilia sp. PAMC28688]